MNRRKALGMIRLIGPNGARGFHVVVGLLIAVLGGLITLGIIQNSN